MNKFGRTYILTIETESGEKVVVTYPQTLRFAVSRKPFANANAGYFTILNLNKDSRQKVLHEKNQIGVYKRVTFQAGYEGSPHLPLVFVGNIFQTYSYRPSGSTDWITEIDAMSGLFAMENGKLDPPMTLPGNYSARRAISQVVASMPRVSLGKIGSVTNQNTRGLPIEGNSWAALTEKIVTDAEIDCFIDNEKVYVLGKNEYITPSDSISEISSATGLLGTPRRYDIRIDAEMLFEPRINLGQVVKLASEEPVYNCEKIKVIGVAHAGTISGGEDGGVKTTANLWIGSALLRDIGSLDLSQVN